MENEKIGKITIIKGTIEVMTGLHIGGIKETVKIGGLDNPIVRDGRGEAFIPGSSIKGKMRYLLELKHGMGNETISEMFGVRSPNNDVKPAKIIFRDAYPIKDTIVIEEKPENTIQTNGQANPRIQERISKGSKFNVEIIVTSTDDEKEKEYLEMLKEGIGLLELNYIGGSGTRGYGKVKFTLKKMPFSVDNTKSGEYEEFFSSGEKE